MLPATLRLTLLGGFEARTGVGPPLGLPAKAQALLAYLALRPGQAQPRDKLAALLWGDSSDAQARGSLRQTLRTLRKALPVTPSSLVAEGRGLALSAAGVEVDVPAFEQCVAHGSPEALEQAVALYRGDLLEGLTVDEPSFEDWLVAERERLRELALQALAKLLAHQSGSGTTERAIQTAARLLVLDPLQEVVHRALMRLYARQGRRAAALRQYQLCVGVLQRELGAEPEPATKQLYQELLQHRPLEPAAGEAAPPRGGDRKRLTAGRGERAVPTVERRLIGRDPELARLRRALEDASKRRGQVVVVLGEAGVGKSALLMALATEAQQSAARVLLGRSYESEQVLAFGPWVDAFRAGQLASEADVLKTLGPVWRAELARLFPELGPPGPELGSPAEDHRRLFEGVAQLVRRLAEAETLVVLLEDLHWADEMGLRLLAFLARRVRSRSVLVVATAREEELAGAQVLRRVMDELTDEPNFSVLTLVPLSRADTAALVRTLARAGSEDETLARTAEQVWAASEGNPFMVVETMRALEEGTAPTMAGALPLPQRVRQVIAGRLERLRDPARQLVPLAAVIGRQFDFALLHRVAGLSATEVAEGLEELVRRRVLEGVGEDFGFTHDRIREVASEQLLPLRRRMLHGLVASALEAQHADNLEPHYVALALHCANGEVWEKAFRYARLAGAQAAGRSAHREAVLFFEQALAALERLARAGERPDEAIDLRIDLRNSLNPLGELDRIFRYLGEAQAIAESVDDRPRLGRVCAYMTNSLWMAAEHRRAVDCGHRALTITKHLDDTALELEAKYRLGQVYHALGEYGRAVEALEYAVRGLDDRRRDAAPTSLDVLARTWLVWCLAERGDFGAASVIVGQALALVEETGPSSGAGAVGPGSLNQPFSRLFALLAAGIVHVARGEFHGAIPPLERALDLCQTWSFPLFFALVAPPLGHALVHSGRIADGLRLLEPAVRQAASMKYMVYQSRRVAWLGKAHLLAGRVDDARELADAALELARRHQERGHEAWALHLLGEVAFRGDPPVVEDGEAAYRQALRLADALGMRPLVAHCHLGLGNLYRLAGRTDEAGTELKAVGEMFHALEMSSSSPSIKAVTGAERGRRTT